MPLRSPSLVMVARALGRSISVSMDKDPTFVSKRWFFFIHVQTIMAHERERWGGGWQCQIKPLYCASAVEKVGELRPFFLFFFNALVRN